MALAQWPFKSENERGIRENHFFLVYQRLVINEISKARVFFERVLAGNPNVRRRSAWKDLEAPKIESSIRRFDRSDRLCQKFGLKSFD